MSYVAGYRISPYLDSSATWFDFKLESREALARVTYADKAKAETVVNHFSSEKFSKDRNIFVIPSDLAECETLWSFPSIAEQEQCVVDSEKEIRSG